MQYWRSLQAVLALKPISGAASLKFQKTGAFRNEVGMYL
jgi:hypothetical protein